MARRGTMRQRRVDHDHSDRPFSLGTHWRADGVAKTAYGSQGEAWTVADERRHASGVVLNIYQCDVCSAWHLGKGNGRER